MKKLIACIAGLFLLIGNIWANPERFDIFGVDAVTQQKIYTSCAELINEYLDLSKNLNTFSSDDNEKIRAHKKQIEQKITAKIKQLDDFAIIDFSVISYNPGEKPYVTLDLVRKNETYRIPGHNKPLPQKSVKKNQDIQDLFAIWNTYHADNMRKIKNNQGELKPKACPVSHCTFGFDAKERKEVLPSLQKGLAAHKNTLINIIKNSADETDRETAIFILGNDTNYRELAKFLIRFTDDPSSVVRNNTMRVLGAIASKHNVSQIDIKRLVKALNYPYVTDRNKAAYVLFGIVNNTPSAHPFVIQQSGCTLLKLLKLQQPNNHDFAYIILKTISQKPFAERDYKNWEQWLRSQRGSACTV